MYALNWHTLRRCATLTYQCNTQQKVRLSKRSFSSVRNVQGGSLSWAELYYASTLARWSGLCYQPAAAIPGLVESEGLRFVAQGRTQYTSWYIADGRVDLDAAHQRLSAVINQLPSASGFSQQHPPTTTTTTTTTTATTQSGGNTPQNGSNGALSQPYGKLRQPQRFVFIRGVQWSSPDTSLTSLSTALSNFWPTAFAPTLTRPPGALVAHGGIAALATDLFEQMRPHLAQQPLQEQQQQQQQRGAPTPDPPMSLPPNPQGATLSRTHTNRTDQAPTAAPSPPTAPPERPPPPPTGLGTAPPLPISFSGHSLGGCLSLMILALTVLHGLRSPDSVWAHKFGSPPMLSHKDGGGGHRVLEVLGVRDTAVKSFILEHDPVPWALVTADPAINALMQYAPVQQLLQMKNWLLGGGPFGNTGISTSDTAAPPAPARFLFEPVGDVYLLSAGSPVKPVLGVGDVEQLLRTAVAEVVARPALAVQAWLDHHHSSYVHDLQASAISELRKHLKTNAAVP